MTDLERIEQKLDMIIDAMGLGKCPRLSPCQMDEKVKADILQFQKKRNMKHVHELPKG